MARFRPLNQEETSSAGLSDVVQLDKEDQKIVNIRAAIQTESAIDVPKSTFKFDKVFKPDSTQA